MQPADVEDVGEAIARVFDSGQTEAVYELAGPHTYAYRELLRTIGEHLGVRRVLVPVPFPIWQMLGFFAEFLPHPPISRNQVELMRINNTASPACPGFGSVGIEPHGLQATLAARAKGR